MRFLSLLCNGLLHAIISHIAEINTAKCSKIHVRHYCLQTYSELKGAVRLSGRVKGINSIIADL